MGTDAALNTDRELWREREGDYYANSIHVTEQGAIGINVSGRVIVQPLEAWHAQAVGRSMTGPSLSDELVPHARKLRADLNRELPEGVGNTIDALCDGIERLLEREERMRDFAMKLESYCFGMEVKAKETRPECIAHMFRTTLSGEGAGEGLRENTDAAI